MTNITKRQLRAVLQGPDTPELSDADLARWFGISQSAVSQWEEDSPIPKLRALELVVKRPDLFGQQVEAKIAERPEAHPPSRRSEAAPAGGAAAGTDEATTQAREVA